MRTRKKKRSLRARESELGDAQVNTECSHGSSTLNSSRRGVLFLLSFYRQDAEIWMDLGTCPHSLKRKYMQAD